MSLTAISIFIVSLFACCLGQNCGGDITLTGSPYNASIGPYGIAALGGNEFTLSAASSILSLEEPSFVTADCNGITSVSYGLNIPAGDLAGNNTCIDSAYGIKALDIPGRSDIYLGIVGDSRLFLPNNTGQGISDLQTGICYQFENAGELIDLAAIGTTVFMLDRASMGGEGALCEPDVTQVGPGGSISGSCGFDAPADGKWMAGTFPGNTNMEGPLGIESIPGENFLLVTLASTNGNASSALQKFTPSSVTTGTSTDVTFTTAPGVTAPNVSEVWSSTNLQIGLAGVHYDRETEFLYAYGGDGKVYRMCSNDSWTSAYIDEAQEVSSPAFNPSNYLDTFVLTGDLIVIGYDVYIVRPSTATIELLEFSVVDPMVCPPVSSGLSSSTTGNAAPRANSFIFS